METVDYLRITVDCPVCGVEDKAWRIGDPRDALMRNRKAKDFNERDEIVPHNTPMCGMTEMRRIDKVVRVPMGCIFVWNDLSGD